MAGSALAIPAGAHDDVDASRLADASQGTRVAADADIRWIGNRSAAGRLEAAHLLDGDVFVVHDPGVAAGGFAEQLEGVDDQVVVAERDSELIGVDRSAHRHHLLLRGCQLHHLLQAPV